MYDDLDLNDMDRSISGMRTLRIPDDEDIFWFLDYLREHWHQYYTRLIEEVKQGLNFMGSVNDGMSDADLSYAIRRSEEINKRNWEIHFALMYPADALSLEFEAFCKEHGIEEKEATIMLQGLGTMA